MILYKNSIVVQSLYNTTDLFKLYLVFLYNILKGKNLESIFDTISKPTNPKHF